MKFNTGVFLILILFSISRANCQISINDWKKDDSRISSLRNTMFELMPERYIQYSISVAAFQEKLEDREQVITIPDPYGGFVNYYNRPSKVVSEEVQHLYTIKTYRGYQVDDPTKLIACDNSDGGGFQASVFRGKDTYYIEPLYKTIRRK